MYNTDKILISEIESICNVLINYLENIENKSIENENTIVILNCLYEKIEKLYLYITKEN